MTTGEVQQSTTPLQEEITERLGTKRSISFFDITNYVIIDCTGIPKSSDRTPSEFTGYIDFDMIDCPYVDSPSRAANVEKNGVPMSRLEQRRLNIHLNEVIGCAAAIRSEMLGKAERPLTALEAHSLLNALKWLPTYLTFRADEPVLQDLMPPHIVIGSNCAAGTSAGLFAELDGAGFKDPDAASEHIQRIRDMITETEKLGTLMSKTSVCAASPQIMRRYMRAVIHGTAKDTPDSYKVLPDCLLPEELSNLFSFATTMEHLGSMHETWFKSFEETKATIEKLQQAAGFSDTVQQVLDLDISSAVIIGKINKLEQQLQAQYDDLSQQTRLKELLMNVALGRIG